MRIFLSLSMLCLGLWGNARAQTCGTTISTYPYSQDFESGAGGWSSGGTNPSRASGTPTKVISTSAAPGTKAWVTCLKGIYMLNENSYVESPCFNRSSLVLPIVELKIWWNYEFSIDGAVLQSSINGGTS